jgi:hypothetical protein
MLHFTIAGFISLEDDEHDEPGTRQLLQSRPRTGSES